VNAPIWIHVFTTQEGQLRREVRLGERLPARARIRAGGFGSQLLFGNVRNAKDRARVPRAISRLRGTVMGWRPSACRRALRRAGSCPSAGSDKRPANSRHPNRDQGYKQSLPRHGAPSCRHARSRLKRRSSRNRSRAVARFALCGTVGSIQVVVDIGPTYLRHAGFSGAVSGICWSRRCLQG